ncbi:MAG TPA: DUF3014 domain-containing protein [Acidobacteriota bacterium]|nr:DUF3014 domain-containing protein [Acidobacteriota bacterium]
MDELHRDEEPMEEPDEEPRKIRGLGIAILAILAVLAALYYFFLMKKPKLPAAAPATVSAQSAEGEKAPAVAPGLEPLAFPAVPLAASDDAVRQFAAAIAADPEFAKWLLTKDLIRKFVVSVDNVANGLSPKTHVDFFSPAGDFRVSRTKAGTLVDPASYTRYAPVVGVIQAIDPTAAVRLYRAVEPLLQEAYNELGYPGVDFDDTLVRAMTELLATPVVDGPIRLEQKVLSYAMTDGTLEALSAAQKQLLRMGPKGVQAVHDKIRALAAVLGIPASRLPQAKVYTPVAR